MKILIVSQYFFPENFKVNDVAFELSKKGHEVTVLTAKPNYPKGKFYSGYTMFNNSEEIIRGVRIIRTPIYPRKNGGKVALSLNYISFLFFSLFACLFRVNGKYDVILAHLTSPITAALPAIWLKKKFKIPLVLWVLDLWPESVSATTNINNRFFYRMLTKLVSFIYRKANRILISSKFFLKSVKEKISDQEVPIIYFPNWAEDIFTKVKKANYELPSFPEGFNLMFAGNIGNAQDFESIIKAAELTKKYPINWLIVGDGRKYNWLVNEKTKLGLSNVALLGRHPLESMPFFFKKADAMLVSLKDEPIFKLTVPAKIQAYMASNKAILAMINGEANQLILESNCGFTCQAGDFKTLANNAIAMSKLSLKERKVLEYNAGQFYANNFTKKILLSKLENQLEQLTQCDDYVL